MSEKTSNTAARWRFLRNFTLLFALWFALSGMTSPLLLSLGAVSSLLTAWLITRLVYTRDDLWSAFHSPRLLLYALWLLGQIVLSSLRVMYLVLHPKMPVDPGFRRIKAEQHTRLGHVFFANSITLTPGTASVDLDDTHILVHSLEQSSAEALDQGEMGRRILGCEKPGADVARPETADLSD